MLDYPPPSKGPLLKFPATKAFLQSPDHWLAPEFCFTSFAQTHIAIWCFKMCSNIRPHT